MARRIVLYGAAGYTGRLVAELLVAAKERPVLAGPSHQNLAALGVLLGKGLDIAVADSRVPESALAMLRKDDVLVSTIGPFTSLGRPAVEAAIIAGATYIDCAAEAPFLRAVVQDLSPHARDAGVALVPGFGFRAVAGLLAAELAIEGLRDATRVDIAYLGVAGPHRWRSAGMWASRGASALLPQFAWRGGELVTVPNADRTQTFEVDGRMHAATSTGGLEALTLPTRHPALTDVGVYHGDARSLRRASMRSAVLSRIGRVPGAPPAIAWLTALPRQEPGPQPEARARSERAALATAYDADGGELRTLLVRGADVHAITASLLAQCALRIAAEGMTGVGALDPVDALGFQTVRDMAGAAGLSVTYPG